MKSRTASSVAPVRRNHIGTISLLVALVGAVGCWLARATGDLEHADWLRVVSAGFEAALIGGLADWFAVTALFRHPLGLPIPHTAIIPARRGKIIESIVKMIEDEWLSPEVIGARLRNITPSELLTDWLQDETHVQRLGAPLRDLLASVARMLAEPEVVDFLGRTIRGQLATLRVDASAGRWLSRSLADHSLDAAFESAALSTAKLLSQPDTSASLDAMLGSAADELYRHGKRMVPMLLRRQMVRRSIVEDGCRYAVSELLYAIDDKEHPLRRWVFAGLEGFAARLAAGDPDAIALIERLRSALVSSLEVEPLLKDLLESLSDQIRTELTQTSGTVADLIDRKLRSGILDLLRDPERREKLDHWVRATADDLLRKNHHQIGLTVRENLEALETGVLVQQIEDRVGGDLQFIRLNGALVGGLIGVMLALIHLSAG